VLVGITDTHVDLIPILPVVRQKINYSSMPISTCGMIIRERHVDSLPYMFSTFRYLRHLTHVMGFSLAASPDASCVFLLICWRLNCELRMVLLAVENKMVLFGSKFWIPEQFRTLTIAVLGPIATETRRHPFSIPAAPFICNHVSLASRLIVVSTAHLYATAFFCMQQTHPFLDPQPAIHLHPCVLSLLI
jgi:hypothetical protein